MRILLVASAFNSLTQRVLTELGDRGHTLAVALAEGDDAVRDAVHRHAPDLIVAPMLKMAMAHSTMPALAGPSTWLSTTSSTKLAMP